MLNRKQQDMNDESPPKSLIYDNFDKFRPYYNTSSPPKVLESSGRIVVMVGTRLNGYAMVNGLHGFLHKQYYAKRHGYKFATRFSNAHENYWPKGLWKVMGPILYQWWVFYEFSRPLKLLIVIQLEF